MAEFFGKYKARVTDIRDPEERGRIRVECPRVLGNSKSAWCEPCSPIAYDGGGDFAVPKLGETVWIEFEEGNPNKPIYVGNWWSQKKSPLPDYSKVGEERIIEFNGVKLHFKPSYLMITTGKSFIELRPDTINYSTPNFEFKGESITMKASGSLNMTGDSDVSLTSSSGNSIHITGKTIIEGDVDMTGNATIVGDTDVTGNTNITGELNVSDDTNIGGSVKVSQNADISSTLSVGGNADIDETLVVKGINMNTHKHNGVTTGTDTSGKPVN